MATIEELQEQLRQAQVDLRWMRRVTWGEVNAGALQYNNQLIKCNQLQQELNLAKGGD